MPRFYIHDMIPPVRGTTTGEKWNGWACPTFTKASAHKIVKAHCRAYPIGFMGPNAKETELEWKPAAWFDRAERRFWFYFPDSDETESFDARIVDGVEVWDIGSHGWCWEQETVESSASASV